MEHLFNLEKLNSFLLSQSINLSGYQLDQLRKYQELLKAWSVKQNLVSKNDLSHVVERHFLPSTYLSHCLPDLIDGKLLDVGSGAGFPGVILKILRPELSLTLLDSSQKKILFLEEVCEQLSLDCPTICQRSEEFIPSERDKYLIVISRAVAGLDFLWKISGHLVQTGGCLYAMKGGDYQHEIAELCIENLNIDIITPGEDWLGISNYLNHKCIVKLER